MKEVIYESSTQLVCKNWITELLSFFVAQSDTCKEICKSTLWLGSFLDSRRLFAIFVIQFELWLCLEIFMSYYLLLVELPELPKAILPSIHSWAHEQSVILTWITGKIFFMCLFSSLPRQERKNKAKSIKLGTARQIYCTLPLKKGPFFKDMGLFWGYRKCHLVCPQGSLLIPKMEFFIKLIFEVWVFCKYAKLSFL